MVFYFAAFNSRRVRGCSLYTPVLTPHIKKSHMDKSYYVQFSYCGVTLRQIWKRKSHVATLEEFKVAIKNRTAVINEQFLRREEEERF